MAPLVSFLIVTLAGISLAYTPPHKCPAYKTKLPKLMHCSTASAFCSSYLGGSAQFTRTSTHTSVIHVTTPVTTIPTTSTVTSGVISVTANTATTSIESTYTSTTTQVTCPGAASRVHGDVQASVEGSGGGKSCGLSPTANSDLVSGACNCFIASKTATTVITTVTIAGPATTSETSITVPSTFTSTPISTVYTGTTTVYACTPAPPLCTPSPVNTVVGGGFEDTNASGNSPSWASNGTVTFVNNSTNAYDGNFYADMAINTDGGSAFISQTLTGLSTSNYYFFNMTYNTVTFQTGYCILAIYLDNNLVLRQLIYSVGTGYTAFAASVQPASSTTLLSVELECNAEGATFSGTLGEVYIDDVSFEQPDLTCAMYLQVVPSGSPVDGKYLYTLSPNPEEDDNDGFTANITSASAYTLDPYGHVVSIPVGYPNYGFWEQDEGAENSFEQIYELDLLDSYRDGYSLVTCSIDPVTLYLSCSNYGDMVVSYYGGVLALGTSSQTAKDGAIPITLQAIYTTYMA